MDSLNDLLQDYDFAEPTEVKAIKKFVQRRFASDVGVRLVNEQIIVIATSAALASALRSNYSELARAADTSKKIIIRIG